jgi:hypothetical protein
MPVQSGGGAATSAGTTYQSTVAAYFILSLICDFDTDLFDTRRPHSISFETANPVDDINITLETNLKSYLQAKRRLSFSLSAGQDLYECLDQFVQQWIADKNAHSFAIVTTSESSKRVTVAMPAIIEAIRSGNEAEFRRDQNKTLIRDLDLFLNAIKSIYINRTTMLLAHVDALEILRKIKVCTLDVAHGSPIEQAAFILLNAKKCISPALFWGNLVSDCATFAASRRSLQADFILDRYNRFFVDKTPSKIQDVESANRLFEFMRSGEIPTGREIVIGRIEPSEDMPFKLDDVCVFEFYRFDQDCNERITFKDGKCILKNGLEINLLGRMATYVGLERFIERQKEKIKSSASKVIFIPANLTDNPENSKCAVQRRQLLQSSIETAEDSLQCIHCEKPISSNAVDFIEYVTADGTPTVGLSHHNCTKPDDRVIGAIYSEFFKEYEFLRNFDAGTWFQQIARGQGGYSALELAKGAAAVMTWSGRSARNATGIHIVEFELEDGTSEFSYHRSQLDRFSKAKADIYCRDMNEWIATQKKKRDPLCFSEESIQFGTKSTLLKTVGADEKLRLITKAKVRKYHSSIARRYDVRDNWFAPVAYIRNMPNEQLLGIGRSIFLITEPLHLDRFIANWKECGLDLGDYEVPILSTDEQFDEFARETFEQDAEFLVDPLFAVEDGHLMLMAGARLISLESLKSTSIKNPNKKTTKV